MRPFVRGIDRSLGVRILGALIGLLLAADRGWAGDGAQTPSAVFPSPFGIGSCYINNRAAADNARWMPQMARIGLRFHRTCETSWDALEPEPGKWTWNALDDQMHALDSLGVSFGALLIGKGRWNTLDAPGSLPVKNLPGWSNYVRQLATHLKGKVHCFEVWNEPPNFTGRDQTPADYARIVIAAHDAVKAVDPSALVGLAAKSVHVNYLEQTIKAGAKDHFDYIVLHPYEVLDSVASDAGTEALYMSIVPTVRKMLSAQNPARRNVPIVFTELGSDAGKGAPRQAYALVKAYTMAIAQGVACVNWFEGMDGDSGPMGLLDGQGRPRPAYHALARLIEHLGDRPAYLGWVLFAGREYGFAFAGAKGTAIVAWGHRDRTGHIDLKQPTRFLDPVSGRSFRGSKFTLSSAPMLLLSAPEDLIAQAQANKNRPFPWNGDYSAARSVSMTMGARHAEKGLHSLSGDDVADAVLGYGGSARAGDIPGGNAFVVDPNFLSYTTEPIEIAVVVRRGPTNVNAGFKLVYESTAGFKSLNWYTVPDDQEWHEVKWRLDDPQFVGMWGYHFTLESDGNVYNKYFLRSVTVTKPGVR